MSDQPIPTPADVAPKPAEPSAPEPVATAPATEPSEAKPNVWEDPEAARAEIERLRRENGAARTNAKQQAAEEARHELAQSIGKALGLVKDEPVDPTELTKQVSASQAAAKAAQVELAVFRAAAGMDADPSALLDSRTFLAKVADIDPSDSVAIAAAIAESIESNPRLGKASGQPPAMRPNPAQGRSASPPATAQEQIAAATAAGDVRGALRLKAAMALQPPTT